MFSTLWKITTYLLVWIALAIALIASALLLEPNAPTTVFELGFVVSALVLALWGIARYVYRRIRGHRSTASDPPQADMPVAVKSATTYRSALVGLVLLIGAVVALAIALPSDDTASDFAEDATVKTVAAAEPASQEEKFIIFEDVVKAANGVMWSISRRAITKVDISQVMPGVLKWEARTYAISPAWRSGGFKLGMLVEQGQVDFLGAYLSTSQLAYAPNCGFIWSPDYNYNLKQGKILGRHGWKFVKTGRTCAAPFISSGTCRVTGCARWSDHEEESYDSWLVSDLDHAKEIFASMPEYDSSWVTDTW